MSSPSRRDILKGAAATGALVFTLSPGKGWAQAWPRRPITLVIQYAEGGGTDTIMRAIARSLATQLDVSIRAVNQPGAGGALATESVAGRPADGHWLLGGAEYNKFFRVLGYAKRAPWEEWQFMKVGRSAPSWSVQPGSRFKTINDVLEAGRENPGTIRISNAGIGTIWHEATLVALEYGTGASFVHVPYDGGAPAALAVLQNEAEVVASGVHEQVEFLRTDKLRNLAAYVPEPLQIDGVAEPLQSVIEAIPSAGQIGMIQGVYQIAINREAPPEILQVLNDAVREAVSDPAYAQVLHGRVMFPEFVGGADADREAALFESVTSWLYFENDMQGLVASPEELGIPKPEDFAEYWPPEGYKPAF
ncbi:Bug family tripartite tricarboxylate transporter substrate binding protein [Aureimonas fodinaquatilis]|nr:tripartite tricarboxylate transporter substrate binding protein [Aureimonas fodinaquatilis]